LQYLRNHGIPQDEIDKTYAESAKFFALPNEVKEPLAWKGLSHVSWICPEIPLSISFPSCRSPCEPRLGRSRPGACHSVGRPRCAADLAASDEDDQAHRMILALADEIAKLRMTRPDFKESMEVGRERDPGDVEPLWKNEWPPAGVVRSPGRLREGESDI
jgi:isopenicillin N synthase-like dioxygenase